MNCTEARRHWDLYHDSEGDSELYFQINEHLAECPACAEWFHRQSRAEDLVSEQLRKNAVASDESKELWGRILTQVGVQHRAVSNRWLGLWSLVALAAGLVIALGLGLTGIRSSEDLMLLTAEWHENVRSGLHPVEFSSRSDLEVETWLRSRVNFPVRCPPRKDTGFQVEGAGVSKLASDDAAWLTGSVDGREVSIFILARASLRRFPAQEAELQQQSIIQTRRGGFEAVMAALNGNVVLVVGEADPDRLKRVLSAYGSYHHHT